MTLTPTKPLLLNINQVKKESPPLKTLVILWSIYQGELVNCRWVQAVNSDLVPTEHINFQEPGVNPKAVWVDENVAQPMRTNDFWSFIKPNT
jgi:hypothetical protein